MRRKRIITSRFDPTRPGPLTRKQKERLKALAAMPDEAIDFSDIPPTSEEFWKTAERGKFYRPAKRRITLRLDADVLAWFKRRARGGRDYQADINRALREYVHGWGKKTG
ncbi:MAG: BrnA antitoxin family protein [Pseudorhodoplanes sp.]|nr:BrnA antitoxin family protein [Pseudorhodoplanes sp.]